MRIDHVAIAVRDVGEAAARYSEALGSGPPEFETVESEGVRIAVIRLENGSLELMQPTGEGSPIAGFLERRGEGIHHVALGVPDVGAEVSRMKGCGVRFLGGVRPGSGGTSVAFAHPRSLHGVLAELCSGPAGVSRPSS